VASGKASRKNSSIPRTMRAGLEDRERMRRLNFK